MEKSLAALNTRSIGKYICIYVRARRTAGESESQPKKTTSSDEVDDATQTICVYDNTETILKSYVESTDKNPSRMPTSLHVIAPYIDKINYCYLFYIYAFYSTNVCV